MTLLPLTVSGKFLEVIKTCLIGWLVKNLCLMSSKSGQLFWDSVWVCLGVNFFTYVSNKDEFFIL